MNARLRWGVGMTALAALAASTLGVALFILFENRLRSDWRQFFDLWSSLAPPAILSAALSAWCLLRYERFLHWRAWAQSLSLTLLALVVYVLIAAFWLFLVMGLRSDDALAIPGIQNVVSALMGTAFITAIVAVVGGLPAWCFEYLVMRAMRRRWPVPAADASTEHAPTARAHP